MSGQIEIVETTIENNVRGVETFELTMKNNVCDYCDEYGVDDCPIHGEIKSKTTASKFNEHVNDPLRVETIFHAKCGLEIFLVTRIGGEWSLAYIGRRVVIFPNGSAGNYGDYVNLFFQRMWGLYLNMTKAIKNERMTFTEYRALLIKHGAFNP